LIARLDSSDKRVHDRRTVAMKDRPGCISIVDVQHAVARAFCLSASEMLSRKRRHRLACARQVAMYLSRELAGGGWLGRRPQAASFPRIGMAFARDHTSVIHACNVVARRRQDDADFARLLDRIAHELTAAAQKPAQAA
jgi:chromosomal replication initiator protein